MTGHTGEQAVAAQPWLRRNVHLAGAPPSFADSPLAGVWARADDTRPSTEQALAGIREELRRQGGNRDWWHRPRRAR